MMNSENVLSTGLGTENTQSAEVLLLILLGYMNELRCSRTSPVRVRATPAAQRPAARRLDHRDARRALPFLQSGGGGGVP